MAESRNAYERMEKLGQGTYGVVYKAKHKVTGRIVAMKCLKTTGSSPAEGIGATTLREIVVLKQLSCPNLVELIEVLEKPTTHELIFEFVSSDLKKILRDLDATKKFLDLEQIQSYAYQILQGIFYCHSRSILHRDLKPENILVNEQGVVKIADFGLARRLLPPAPRLSPEIVTLWYRSPELMLGRRNGYCGSVDMWSYGCIFAELFTMKPLFPGDSEIGQLFVIFKALGTPTPEMWPKLEEECPDYHKDKFPQWTEKNLGRAAQFLLPWKALNLLEETFNFNPDRRISARRAAHHAFFEDLDKSTLPAPAVPKYSFAPLW